MKDINELLKAGVVSKDEYEIYSYSIETPSVRKIADRFKISKEDVRTKLRKVKKLIEE